MIPFTDATAFELGFTPAAAALFSLGPQNTLLLRQRLSGRKALIVLGTCYASELGLMLLGTMGLGAVVAAMPTAVHLLRTSGAAYLLLMSTRAFTRTMRNQPAGLEGHYGCASRVFVTALTVSVFNPLAWVESVLVLGAVSSTVPRDLVFVFATGASLGTLCRLGVLGLGASVLQPMFRWPSFRRAFETLAGLVMVSMAVVLLMEFQL